MSSGTSNDRFRSRQEIYDRIRETSKEEFILEDMIRLGFWPRTGQVPRDTADEIRRRGEIQRELLSLRTESRHLYNEQALLKELRKRRLQESKRKRKETKERHERERQERAAAWKAKQAGEIGYLGEGVSGGLSARAGNDERLQQAGLPPWQTPEQIAAAMGITVGALRFLCYCRKTGSVSHYVRFKLPKKTGGERLISAPLPRLKTAQHHLLTHLLTKLTPHDAAHGFRTGRSIVSNARPHTGREVIVNVDLKDFFPTVGYPRVKGLFRSLGYSDAAATVLGLLCTEPDVEEVELDGKRYFVSLSDRHLPQGAPTSPAITNLLCRRLDRRLHGMATQLGFTYTRYADDLTFSAPPGSARHLCNLLGRLTSIVTHEGFVVHPGKTRVLRRGSRQEVTGIVVNERPSLDRQTLRRFRATLFQIEKDGPAGKRWGKSPDVIAAIAGYANYVHMVDPQKGTDLKARVRGIIQKYGWKQPPRPHYKKKIDPPAPAITSPAEPSAATATAPPPEPGKPKKKWWKLF